MVNKLQAFLLLLTYKSFTRAAEELSISQSAFSQSIASLEKELGVILFKRKRNNIELTPEGYELLLPIRAAYEQETLLKKKAMEIKRLINGEIRIGSFSSVTSQILPDIVSKFSDLYPQVKFAFFQGDYNSIEEWIKKGKVDIGFVSPKAVVSVETLPLYEDEFSVVFPCGHKFEKLDSVELEHIARENYIQVEEGNFAEPIEAFNNKNLSPSVRIKLHDDYSILSMVERNLGISIIPNLFLETGKFNVDSRPINPPIKRCVSIAYNSWKLLPIQSKRFLEFLLAEIKKHPSKGFKLLVPTNTKVKRP